MKDTKLKLFNLVGGTALALYIGHRISIDLDFFSLQPFNVEELEKHLSYKYDFKEGFREKNTLKGNIKGVKIDCITYDYPLIENTLTTENSIRLYGIKDIAAMKLSAIADNGTRLKDFIDIACLSTKLSLSDMIYSYQKKYPEANPISPIKGLGYYNDINFKEPIQMITGNYKWVFIEKRLNSMVKNDKTKFSTLPVI